eukprot:10693077-Lingulodinium_polyedra.AAC.1
MENLMKLEPGERSKYICWNAWIGRLDLAMPSKTWSDARVREWHIKEEFEAPCVAAPVVAP